jgi:fibrillarin-like pre-rRNA processing protein
VKKDPANSGNAETSDEAEASETAEEEADTEWTGGAEAATAAGEIDAKADTAKLAIDKAEAVDTETAVVAEDTAEVAVTEIAVQAVRLQVPRVAPVEVGPAAVDIETMAEKVAASENMDQAEATTNAPKIHWAQVTEKEPAAAAVVSETEPQHPPAEATENTPRHLRAAVQAEATDATDPASASGDKTAVPIRVKPHPQFAEIYQVTLEDGAHRLATKNLAPGRSVYGERLIRFEGVEYRVWDAFRSKLAGAILKGLHTVPILPRNNVLYLGAASGTTPSHVSDIVGEEGHVYCVEFAQRSLRELVANVVAYRVNMSPFLADARMPQRYGVFIPGKLDAIYCDIATPEQAKVLADNADLFLKAGGWVLLAVKSQSIDVTLPPPEVYQMQAKVLRNRGFRVEQVVDLEPYDIAHAMIVAQR